MCTSLAGRFGRRGPSRVEAAEGRLARRVALVLLFVLSFPEGLASREKEVVARWEELAPLVERRDVETVLANGVYVRGRALKVLPEALEVDVRKTSDAALIPKGQTRIPRELLSVLTVRWKKRLGRVLLTPAMFLATPSLGMLMFGDSEGAGSNAAVVATFFGFTTAGYVLGDRIDTKRMRIVLASKPPAGAPAGGEEACRGIEVEGGIPRVN